MSEGVTGYEAPYFLPTVREVLDPLLSQRRFIYAGDYREVSAYWRAGDVFLRVAYLPETTPRYELQMSVGLSEADPVGPKLSGNSVALWRLLPSDVDPATLSWRFDSAEALERQLRRAWAEVVLPYGIPLAGQRDRLAEAIQAQNDEASANAARMMDDRLLKFARAEFDAGRFAEAVHAYAELDEQALARADRKRFELARRRS